MISVSSITFDGLVERLSSVTELGRSAASSFVWADTSNRPLIEPRLTFRPVNRPGQ